MGLEASSGYGIAQKVVSFIMLIPSSLMQSMSAFVAQNVGAGKEDRARKAMRTGMLLGVCIGVFVSALSFFRGDILSAILYRQSGFLYRKIGRDSRDLHRGNSDLSGIQLYRVFVLMTIRKDNPGYGTVGSAHPFSACPVFLSVQYTKIWRPLTTIGYACPYWHPFTGSSFYNMLSGIFKKMKK